MITRVADSLAGSLVIRLLKPFWRLCFCVAALTGPAIADDGGLQWRFEAPQRIVAVGDIHGAYEELTDVLRQTGLIDEDTAWIGGDAHFVSLGDMVDRGARSRDVMDLMMRLQEEAAAAGGAVHVVLGNHEVMNLTGDLRYASRAEFAAFEDSESPEQRAAARRAFGELPDAQGLDETELDRRFDNLYPPGFFGHRAAFAPGGRYGEWLLGLPFLIVVNDTAFVHGGLPPSVAELGGAKLNQQLSTDLRQYLHIWSGAAPQLPLPVAFRSRPEALETVDPESAARLAELTDNSLLFSALGPLWYRETALCHPLTLLDGVSGTLDGLGARRVVLGHTTMSDGRMKSRVEQRVVLADSGMLTEHYDGNPAALLIDGERLSVRYRGAQEAVALPPEVRRIGQRPANMSDDELEDFLRTAEVVNIENVPVGVTKPRRVTLEKEGLQVRAVFKTVETPIHGSRRDKKRLMGMADRFQYEMAAYELDRLLDWNMVPVTVERTINGETGSLQFWVDGLISLLDKNEQGIPATGHCPLNPQYNLMYIFDSLILNTDRTEQNMTFLVDEFDDWLLVLIDHSRSFRLGKNLPKDFERFPIQVGEGIGRRLKNLDYERLDETLGPYLEREQVRAILQRRDDLLRRFRQGGSG